MATVFKTFLNDDIATTRTLLHEAVPVTGGIVNGTAYDETNPAETNIKNYTHEMFQSIYDYTYTKSSANHIFDISVGTGLNADTNFTDADAARLGKKKIIYNEFAQILAGHDIDGNIRAFDSDGDLSDTTNALKYDECYIISIARLLNKDEIKKGSFFMKLNVQPTSAMTETAGVRQELLISDEGSADDYKVNSPAGDYGILKCRTYKHYEGTWDASKKVFTQTSANEVYTLDYDENDSATGYERETLSENGSTGIDTNVGLIFYQAGVVILSPYVFVKYAAAGGADLSTSTPTSVRGKLPPSTTYDNVNAAGFDSNSNHLVNASPDIGPLADDVVTKMFKEKNIPDNCTGLRNRIHQIAFNNTTELNSTIYFCRVNHNDFNYSSNPTYLDKGQIRVKQTLTDAPISYLTSVGLYSANNELLAVAKLSEPLRKDPTNEMVLRVRLDY